MILKHVCHFFKHEDISGSREELEKSDDDQGPNPDDGQVRRKNDVGYISFFSETVKILKAF